MLSETYNDVTRCDIAVNKVARMYVPQATELGIIDISSSVVDSKVEFTHQLPGQKHHSLDRERKVALNKEVLKGLSKAIDRHRIITGFRTKPMDTRDTNTSLKPSVDIKLIA
jgi:hypothetical protein